MKQAVRWLLAGFWAYLAFLFFIALFLFPAGDATPNLMPFKTMRDDWTKGGWPFLINFVGNLVAFMPMGAVPRVNFGNRFRRWHAAAFGLGLSTLIEGGQLFSGRRVFDVDDLILNTTGALIGYTLASRLTAGQGPSRGSYPP